MNRFDFNSGIHETYAKGRQLAPDVLAMWMNAVRELLKGRDVRRVIDLGAGTGRFSPHLAETLDAEVVGIDPSWRMLANAAGRRVVAFAEALPLRDGCADVVFASMVIHHFDDLDRAASEIRRVLKQGGALLVRTAFADTLDVPYHRFFPSVVDIEQELLPNTSTFLKALDGVQLPLVEHRRLEQRMDGSLRDYADRMRQRAMSPLRMIPDDDFDRGMAALDEAARAEEREEAVFEVIDLLHFSAA